MKMKGAPAEMQHPAVADLPASEALPADGVEFVLDAEERELREKMLRGEPVPEAYSGFERDRLLSQFFKIAFVGSSNAAANLEKTAEETREFHREFDRDLASLKEAQRRTRAMIEELVNG